MPAALTGCQLNETVPSGLATPVRFAGAELGAGRRTTTDAGSDGGPSPKLFSAETRYSYSPPYSTPNVVDVVVTGVGWRTNCVAPTSRLLNGDRATFRS